MGKQSIFDNKILIVDDNFELRKMVRTFLAKEGYTQIEAAVDCKSAAHAIASWQPDFIILDVNLPDGDGFSLMKRMKEDKNAREIPVLFLSARDKDADRLTGLGLGADDYMVKPFLPKELLLRMAAILKRSYRYGAAQEPNHMLPTGAPFGKTAAESALGQQTAEMMQSGYASRLFGRGILEQEAEQWQQHHILQLGSHVIDFDAATVSSADKTDTLTAKELKILETLEQSRGKIVTFDNLCAAVWNAQYYTYENTVMVHMRRLREKVEDDPSHPKWIVTARGIGYKMNAKPAEGKTAKGALSQ